MIQHSNKGIPKISQPELRPWNDRIASEQIYFFKRILDHDNFSPASVYIYGDETEETHPLLHF